MANLLKHKLLDRAYIIAEMFDTYIAQHQAAKECTLQRQITSIRDQLWQLYNSIGGLDD